jgi:hypothetical protein
VRKLVYLLLPLGLSGCGHSQPFGSNPDQTDQPFDPSPPVRLTLNRGHDREPTWMPDGSGILYSTQLAGRQDNDICLALLPPGGGSQRFLTCHLSSEPDVLTETIESPAPSSDGRLAFVGASFPADAVTPDNQAISLAPLTDPAARQSLIAVPYTIPGGRVHGGVSRLAWLGPNRLLYLAEAVHIVRDCEVCPRETLRSGLEAVWLNSGSPQAEPQVIPGSDYASGVSTGPTEDEVFYTLGGDSRVYHRVLSTGAISVVYDFAAAGIVRDIHVVGTRIAAVVGGRVHFAADPALGPTQWDSGGIVHVVDLQEGTDLALEGPGLFRRPRLSPSATGVVAEGYALLFTTDPETSQVDTTVSELADLYLFGQP